MFGKRKDSEADNARELARQALAAKKAAKPDDKDLPVVPPLKTWSVDVFDFRDRHQVSGHLHVSRDNWVVFIETERFEWTWNGICQDWAPRRVDREVARISKSAIRGIFLVVN